MTEDNKKKKRNSKKLLRVLVVKDLISIHRQVVEGMWDSS